MKLLFLHFFLSFKYDFHIDTVCQNENFNAFLEEQCDSVLK